MKLVIVSSGDFFSDYGGGQQYCRNVVDMLIERDSYKNFAHSYFQKEIEGLEMLILSNSLKGTDGIASSDYKGYTVVQYGKDTADCELERVISDYEPDEVHINGDKARFVRMCHRLGIRSRVTAHHGGIVCPAGALLMWNDDICNMRVTHDNCLRCILYGIRSGRYWYPLMKHISQRTYERLGRWLDAKSFIPFVTPIGVAARMIADKQRDWNDIKNYADEIVAPSVAMGDAMLRNGLDKSKLKIIPHSIPAIENKSKGMEDGICRLYYIGRINRYKGIHVMLEAFDGIEGNAELHIIGTCGENRRETRYMNRLKNRYGRNPKIIWHGKVAHEECDKMISEYDAMIHPAIYLEVFGLTIAESLAMGKYVIATRCGGAEMQITDGVNGTLVPTNDVESLRKAMIEYIKGKECRQNRE